MTPKMPLWFKLFFTLIFAYGIFTLMIGSYPEEIQKLESDKFMLDMGYKQLVEEQSHNKQQKGKLASEKNIQWYKNRNLLKPGFEESALMKSILSCTRSCTEAFSIIDLHIMEPYYYDTCMDAQSTEVIDIKDIIIDMETGMPVGVEVDDGTWQGIEVIPVKLTYEGTFKSLIEFLKGVSTRKLPFYTVRSLDVNFITDEFIKGTVILGFPLFTD